MDPVLPVRPFAEIGRRASVRAGRLSAMTGAISDPRALVVLRCIQDEVPAEDLPARTGLAPDALAALLARLTAFGLVRRQRRGRRVSWSLAGTHVAAWLVRGYAIAASLRRG